MKNQSFNIRLGFALNGIVCALRSENSFRIQIVAACGALAVLLWQKPPPIWWAVIALTVAAVLAAELFNTALEHLVDHLHPELHPRIKIVKDCAAGAVLLLSACALCVAAAFVWQVLS